MLVIVSEQVFWESLKQNKAVPNGFQLVGGYIQTRFLVEGKEVARRSQDSQGTIYEVEEDWVWTV